MPHRLLLPALICIAPVVASAAGAPVQPPAAPEKVPAAATPSTPDPKAQPAEDASIDLRVPLFDERFSGFPVATVGDEVIELRELLGVLAGTHEARKEGQAGKQDFKALLDRLIDVRLIVHEARETGLDELPETADAMAAYKERLLLDSLQVHATKGTKADPAEVEKLFQAASREWKVKSALFAKAEDANAAAAQVAGGRSFDEVVKQAVEGKRATGGEEGQFVAPGKMLPQVAEAVAKLAPGASSAPIQLPAGWTLVRLEEVRHPENPRARAEAEGQSLARKKAEALKKYYDGLVKKWVKVDEKLFVGLDYEAPKPGFAALKKDKRVLARIQGEKSITVAAFSEELEKTFWHGIAEAIKSKSVNKGKATLLDGMISKVVVAKEARRVGLDATEEFRRKVTDRENSLLFGAYVQKAIIPGVKVEEEPLKKYYEEHKREYSYPAFYRLEAIGFRDVKVAQAAVEKLRSGTDFKWLRANADGQLSGAERKVVLDGSTVSAGALPPELAKLLAGSKKGDVRLHSESDQHYVVQVIDATPAAEQSFAEVRGSIVEKVAGERIVKAIKDAADKLRGAYPVKVFITRMGI